jgi:3-hydroxybutyryl-CoA dehydrogenase
MMAIKKIGVVGAGTMGAGIAQVAATSGFEIILNDVGEDYLQRSLKIIDKSLTKLSEKGKIEEDKEKILSRIKTTTSLSGLKEVDFAVEAVFEDFEVKKKILLELDKLLKPSVILTSNTSSISITRLGALTGRPSQHAFHESRAPDGIGGADQRDGNFPGDIRRGQEPCREDGEGSCRGQ